MAVITVKSSAKYAICLMYVLIKLHYSKDWLQIYDASTVGKKSKVVGLDVTLYSPRELSNVRVLCNIIMVSGPSFE